MCPMFQGLFQQAQAGETPEKATWWKNWVTLHRMWTNDESKGSQVPYYGGSQDWQSTLWWMQWQLCVWQELRKTQKYETQQKPIKVKIEY